MHDYQSKRQMQGTPSNLIDLSDLTQGKNDLQKIKSNYFERMSKTNPSQNVF